MALYLCGFALLSLFTMFLASLLIWPEMKSAPKRSVIILGGFLLTSAGLYAIVGSPTLLVEYAERETTRNAVLASLAEKEKAAEANPESANAWAELGNAYLKAGRPGMAMGALKRAVVLSHGEPALLLAYGKAQVIASGGNVTDEAADAFRMALLQLNDPQAKLFIAIHTAAKGKQAEAKKMLQGLISAASTPEEVRQAATEQLSQLVNRDNR